MTLLAVIWEGDPLGGDPLGGDPLGGTRRLQDTTGGDSNEDVPWEEQPFDLTYCGMDEDHSDWYLTCEILDSQSPIKPGKYTFDIPTGSGLVVLEYNYDLH